MSSGQRTRRFWGGAAAAALCATGAAAALGGGGGAAGVAGLAPVAVAAATSTPTPCILPIILLCPTPKPTPTQAPGSTPTAAPSGRPPGSPGSTPGPTLSVIANPSPNVLNLPTETAAPTPRFAPGAPELAVQSVGLSSLAGDTVKTGSTFNLLATCSAKNGTDTYVVSGARVDFTVTGPVGSSPAVDPPSATCGDTGNATVAVSAGTVPGDIAIMARSGNASGTLAIHVTAGDIPATPTPTPINLPAGPVTTTTGGASFKRTAAVAGLFVLAGLVLVGSIVLGRRRRGAIAGPNTVPGPRRG